MQTATAPATIQASALDIEQIVAAHTAAIEAQHPLAYGDSSSLDAFVDAIGKAVVVVDPEAGGWVALAPLGHWRAVEVAVYGATPEARVLARKAGLEWARGQNIPVVVATVPGGEALGPVGVVTREVARVVELQVWKEA